MRPLILISGGTEEHGPELSDFSMNVSMSYPQAVSAAGGTPWLLPCLISAQFLSESVARADGVLLTGGDDVQPELYGRKNLPAALARTVHRASAQRDLFELLLIEEALGQGKPILAICRGHQLLNVALGGTLLVDIAQEAPGAINHRRLNKKSEVVHEVKLAVGSLLAGIVGQTRLGVNSTHHQAVAKIAKPLQSVAVSIDGMIEGLEWVPEAGQKLPFLLAVQFHPERLFPQHAGHFNIFKSFVRACRTPL
jgi:putative glutamine amidotransferase